MEITRRDYIAHYRSQGLTPIPVYEIKNGDCTCPEKGNCNSPGKHPRVGRKTAILANDEQWDTWLRTWPEMNIGILTGSDTGIFAVDIDPRHGGDTSLKALLAEHGELPVTVSAQTGGGGTHYLFRIPEGLEIKNSVGDEQGLKGVAPGIDIRGNGGFIVVEPSVTKGNYQWNQIYQPTV